MAAPQLVTNAGAGVYYIPQEDVPNPAAAFLAGFYGVYGRFAEKLTDARLAAMDPTARLAYAAKLAQAQADKEVGAMGLLGRAAAADAKRYGVDQNMELDWAKYASDTAAKSQELQLRGEELKLEQAKAGVFTSPETRAIEAVVRRKFSTALAAGSAPDSLANIIGADIEKLNAANPMAAQALAADLVGQVSGRSAVDAQELSSLLSQGYRVGSAPLQEPSSRSYGVRVYKPGGEFAGAGGGGATPRGGGGSRGADPYDSERKAAMGVLEDKSYDLLAGQQLKEADRQRDLLGRIGDPAPRRDQVVKPFDFSEYGAGRGPVGGSASTEGQVETDEFDIEEGEEGYTGYGEEDEFGELVEDTKKKKRR